MNKEDSRFERFASIAKSYIESIIKFARGEWWMSQTLLKHKCIHCGSDDIHVLIANPVPNKIAYRCRKCTTSWRNVKWDLQENVFTVVENLKA